MLAIAIHNRFPVATAAVASLSDRNVRSIHPYTLTWHPFCARLYSHNVCVFYVMQYIHIMSSPESNISLSDIKSKCVMRDTLWMSLFGHTFSLPQLPPFSLAALGLSLSLRLRCSILVGFPWQFSCFVFISRYKWYQITNCVMLTRADYWNVFVGLSQIEKMCFILPAFFFSFFLLLFTSFGGLMGTFTLYHR